MLLSLIAIATALLAFDTTVGQVNGLMAQGKYSEAEAALKERLHQTNLEPADRVRLLLQLVEVHRQAGQSSLAGPLADEAVRLAESTGDRGLAARALYFSAIGSDLQGNHAEAESLFRRALTLAPEFSPVRAEILIDFAGFLNTRGIVAEAELLLTEAMKRFEHLETDKRVNLLANWGRLRLNQNRLTEASRLLLRANAALPETDGSPLHGELWNLIGIVALRRGAQNEAAEAWIQSSAYYKTHQHRFRAWPQIVSPLLNLADLHLRQGHFEQAVSVAMEADSFLANLPEPSHYTRGVALDIMGCAYLHLNRLEYAKPALEQAIDFYGRSQVSPDPSSRGIVLVNLAGIAWRQKRYRDAAGYLERAEQSLSRPDAPQTMRHAQLMLSAKVARKLGNKAAARAFEQQAKTLASTEILNDRYTVSVQALRLY